MTHSVNKTVVNVKVWLLLFSIQVIKQFHIVRCGKNSEKITAGQQECVVILEFYNFVISLNF